MPTIRDFWLSMKSVLRCARQIINAELEPLNLTSAEGDILFHLLTDNDGLTQEKLTERLDVGKAPVSRTVDSLVGKGYVKRVRHPNDARAYRITLTEKAVDIGASIENAYNGVYEIVKRGIPEAEFERLAVLLNRVAGNLHAAEVKK
ncbi:MAG: MarR family transcriptional regulator [Bacillota bacterium]